MEFRSSRSRALFLNFLFHWAGSLCRREDWNSVEKMIRCITKQLISGIQGYCEIESCFFQIGEILAGLSVQIQDASSRFALNHPGVFWGMMWSGQAHIKLGEGFNWRRIFCFIAISTWMILGVPEPTFF